MPQRRYPAPLEPAIEAHLVTAIRAGDEQAFCRVFRAYNKRLVHYATKFTRSRVVAEDVVQDVFLKLWVDRSNIEVRGSLLSYLLRSVRNRAYDVGRRDARVTFEAVSSAADAIYPKSCTATDDAEQRVLVDDLRQAMEGVLDTLTPRIITVFRKSLWGEITYHQIGVQLGITANTVRVHLIHARRVLWNEFVRRGLVIERHGRRRRPRRDGTTSADTPVVMPASKALRRTMCDPSMHEREAPIPTYHEPGALRTPTHPADRRRECASRIEVNNLQEVDACLPKRSRAWDII